MDKKTFRKICIDNLKRTQRANNYKLDKMVCKQLSREIEHRRSKVIMLYIPLKIEVNISSLIRELRRERKIVLVPFMEGESFSLVKYRLPLKIKKFGVKEPPYSKRYYNKIDLAIVPVIGIDKRFRRVGFGKGFYDRFFEKNHKNIKEVLFVGRKNCISSEVITDDYDVKGELYITPKNSYIN